MPLYTSTGVLTNRQEIVNQAINEVVAEQPCIVNSPCEFAFRANNRVIQKMIDYFPQMCQDAREINQKKYALMREFGNKGKFTDTYGWSNDGTMLFEYDIPPDLYHFMRVAVYKDFWSEDNAKVWKGMMKKICRDTQPLSEYEAGNLLVKIKQHYGSNKDGSLT